MRRLVAGPEGCLDHVGGGIPLGLKPAAAPVPVVPPLPLHTGGVWSEVKVAAPLAFRRTGRGTRYDLSAEAELVHATLAAIGAIQQEGHFRIL